MKACIIIIALLVAGCASQHGYDPNDPIRAQLNAERECRAAYTASTGDFHGAFAACERLRNR